MKTKGGQRLSPVQLKDGFYIEVCDIGIKRGMKIRSDNKKGMDDATLRYATNKHVIILGEYKNGIPFVNSTEC